MFQVFGTLKIAHIFRKNHSNHIFWRFGMMVNTPLDRGLFVDKLRLYWKILNSLRFLGQNDFSTFFNEYYIYLGWIRIHNMILINEKETVICIFMLSSAPKTLKISNKQNIGYKAMYSHVYEYTNPPLWLILSCKSDLYYFTMFWLQIWTDSNFTTWADILNILDNLGSW